MSAISDEQVQQWIDDLRPDIHPDTESETIGIDINTWAAVLEALSEARIELVKVAPLLPAPGGEADGHDFLATIDEVRAALKATGVTFDAAAMLADEGAAYPQPPADLDSKIAAAARIWWKAEQDYQETATELFGVDPTAEDAATAKRLLVSEGEARGQALRALTALLDGGG